MKTVNIDKLKIKLKLNENNFKYKKIVKAIEEKNAKGFFDGVLETITYNTYLNIVRIYITVKRDISNLVTANAIIDWINE